MNSFDENSNENERNSHDKTRTSTSVAHAAEENNEKSLISAESKSMENLSDITTTSTHSASENGKGNQGIDIVEDFLKLPVNNYNLPINFNFNILNNHLAFTIYVENLMPHSLDYINGEEFVYIKYKTIPKTEGANQGLYALYILFDNNSYIKINSIAAIEINNKLIIITLKLSSHENLKDFFIGLHKNNMRKYQIDDNFLMRHNHNSAIFKNTKFSINNSHENEVEIDIKLKNEIDKNQFLNQIPVNTKTHPVEKSHEKCSNTNKQKKKKRCRSLSESSCDDIKILDTLDLNTNNNKKFSKTSNNCSKNSKKKNGCNDDNKNKSQQLIIEKRIRSISETSNSSNSSNTENIKGILKHASSYGRSSSESSSFEINEELFYSYSLDKAKVMNFIPINSSSKFNETNSNETISQEGEILEICKKTVRFNDIIKKQIFR